MCGICGQYNFGSQASVLRQDIERMAGSLAHRGPDDEGYYVAGGFGGQGFTQGPLGGRLIAELITTGRPSLDLTPYRADRAPAVPRSR